MERRTVLIAGPTASGKSTLALRLAVRMGGVVVNVDSMQVYSVLDRLTARPQPEALAQALHRLYGHVHPSSNYSTGAWLADVEAVMTENEGVPLIFVGGTGLYFRALLGGLSPMPEVPESIRVRLRNELAAIGAGELHRRLQSLDPESAREIQPGDPQRILRALEVLEASGESIRKWRSRAGTPLIDPGRARKFLIEPQRTELAQRIERRFRDMVRLGGLDEVRAVLELGLDPAMPAMKAIGVRELRQFLEGRLTLEDAVLLAATATRQYAKRQLTWFRHQAGPDWEHLAAPDLESIRLP